MKHQRCDELWLALLAAFSDDENDKAIQYFCNANYETNKIKYAKGGSQECRVTFTEVWITVWSKASAFQRNQGKSSERFKGADFGTEIGAVIFYRVPLTA